MTTRAITYGRQSKAREDDSQASPEAQKRKTRALIRSRGWRFVEHYEDVGRSGYDPKVSRPGLDAALAALRDGRADALVVYRLDRLTRRGVVEAARLAGVIADAGAALVSVEEQFLDTSTPIGRGIFGLFAAMAEQESANISARTTAAKATLRAVGSHAGGRTPYGTRAESRLEGSLVVRTLVEEPAEAAVVREVVGRVLEGESVSSLVRDLNARGIRTRSGAEWGTSTLTRLLRAPSLAGYMTEHREGDAVQRVKDGRPVIATDDEGCLMRPWEGIVDPGDWHRLQDALDARPVLRGSSRAPSLLGGFLLTCGACQDEPRSLMGADRRPSSAAGGSYRCMRHRRGSKRCSGTSVALRYTEDYVAGEVWRRVAGLDPEDPRDAALLSAATERFAARSGDEGSGQRAALQASVDAAREALLRLDDDRSAGLFDGDLGAERYRRQSKALTARYDAARAALADLNEGPALTPFLDIANSGDNPEGDPIGPGSVWAGWGIERQREWLALFLDRVDVLKTPRRAGGNAGFLPADRLRLVWASEEAGE